MSVPPVNHHNHNETLCCPASALWVSVFDNYKHNWWVLIKDPGYRDRITSSATNWLLPTQIDTNYSISVSSVIPVLATWLQNLVMLWIGVIHQLMQYGRLNGFTMEFTKYQYWELGELLTIRVISKQPDWDWIFSKLQIWWIWNSELMFFGIIYLLCRFVARHCSETIIILFRLCPIWKYLICICFMLHWVDLKLWFSIWHVILHHMEKARGWLKAVPSLCPCASPSLFGHTVHVHLVVTLITPSIGIL